MQEIFIEVNEYIDKREGGDNLNKAERILLDLKSKYPENDIICGKLSSTFFYKGTFEADPKKKELYFEHGVNYGKEAVTMNPKALYGNFWYASNLGQLGLCRGIMASLASIDPFKKSMEIVVKENEHFFFGGPHRALGRLFHQAPGWPISIGSKTKAAEHLERAVELYPDFFNNRSFLAEFFLDIGKKDKAKVHLDWLVAAEPKPEHKIEDTVYKNVAGDLLKRYF